MVRVLARGVDPRALLIAPASFFLPFAGVVATLVPDAWWQAVFLTDSGLPRWVVAIENAIVGPLVAASTFIGSMGNIPLATVLASSGAAFAGIMAFIYSDLMIPPLVRVNAKYYGVKGALYIAAVMFVSIVATAMVWLQQKPLSSGEPAGGHDHEHGESPWGAKRIVALACAAAVIGGLITAASRSLS